MKKPFMYFLSISGFALLVFMGSFFFSEPLDVRAPASVDGNYESLGACEKQEIIWSEVQSSLYTTLPSYDKLGPIQLLRMSLQELSLKSDYLSDFSPKGWVKYIHRRGALAKVKIVSRSDKYSGIFQGADCALLRLSLTYSTKGSKPVAPGLALKVLRDGETSANVSALVSLEGQGKDFNFMKRPMSNIVPQSSKLGQRLVHRIFSRVSSYPEELKLQHMAEIDAQGKKAEKAHSPRQIFFVPKLSFKSESHDVREDFIKVAADTLIYEIHALPETFNDFDFGEYTDEKAAEFLKASTHIADIITTSEFTTSAFGDDGIFFRHEVHAKKGGKGKASKN